MAGDYRDIYVTVQGDTWDTISYKVYGSCAYMDKLIRHNPEHIETAVFSAGVELVCPDVDVPAAAALPPWKQAGETDD
jgi:phage tail protein X